MQQSTKLTERSALHNMSESSQTIVQLVPEMKPGGVEYVTITVARALAEAGHRSIVISNGGSLVGQLEHHGVEHVAMPIHRKSPTTFWQAASLRRFFSEQNVDAVYARSRVPAWVCRAALPLLPAAKRPRFLTAVHGLHSVNRYSAVMTSGDRVVAVSETVRQYIRDNYPQCPPERVTVVPHGVDPAAYPSGYRPGEDWFELLHATYPGTRDKRLVSLIGRITRLKGHHDFLDVIAALPNDVHGLIVGGDDPRRVTYANEVREAIVARGLSGRVTMTGHRSDVREVMAASDVVMSLSQQPESFGLTVLEALTLGRPVVGYNHGGVGEVLSDFFPSGRVPVGDTQVAAERVQECLQTQPMIPGNVDWTLEKSLAAELRVILAPDTSARQAA